jgi:hypothetical protein
MSEQATVATTAKQAVASAATISTTIAAAAAAIAATVAGNSTTTMATTVAAIGKQAAVATMTAKQSTATTTIAAPTRLRIVLMAHHANGQNRKENGDSSDNRAIHLTFLQYKRLRPAAETDSLHPTSTAHKSEETKPIVISSRHRLHNGRKI